jgi:Bacteriophage tail sheath protein
MVVQVSYPGVYIVEKPSGVHTITAVSTSIAAFFGQALEGPVNKPVRLLSPLAFEKTFGKPHPDSDLSTAVRLFFQNGGSDCYVVRLVKSGTGQRAVAMLKRESGEDVLKFKAKEIGSWGNELAVNVDYNTSQPEETFNLRIYRIDNAGIINTVEELLNCSPDIDNPRFVTKLVKQKSNLVDCEIAVGSGTPSDYKGAAIKPGHSISRRPLANGQAGVDELANIISSAQATFKFRISVDGSPFYEVNLQDAFAAGDTTADAINKMKQKINSSLPASPPDPVNIEFVNGPGTFQLVKLSSNTAEQKSIVIQKASSNDLAKTLMLGIEQGGIERSSYAPLRPASNGIVFDINLIDQLALKPQDAFNMITLDGQPIDLGDSLKTVSPSSEWLKSKISGVEGTDGIREKFAIIAGSINASNIGYTAHVAGSRLVINRKSGPANSVSVLTTQPDDVGSFFRTNSRLYLLDSGQEGDPPDVASYLGNEIDHSGLYALDLVDLFNLMVIPKDKNLSEDDYRSLWGPASIYCNDHKAFLIIDPPDSWTSPMKVLDPAVGVNSLRVGLSKDYAAVYFPNLVIRENNVLRTVGPGGAIAGLYARTASSGAGGVWTAAAGMSADIRGGISDLEIILTDAENGPLNKEGVNCLRRFPTGIVSWGARTLDGADDFGSEWKYIPVRLLALLIEISLYRGTKFAVFLPNDEPLWAQLRGSITTFMRRLFRAQAFQGKTEEEAFFVKCDSETTTPDDQNQGIVNILVGFAPLKPAEFVVITIQQMAGEL